MHLNAIRCYRPNGTCYAVFTPGQWAKLRKAGIPALDAELKRRRDTGIVIKPEPLPAAKADPLPEHRPTVRACECEHACHVYHDARSPNGNPGHRYLTKFASSVMRLVRTDGQSEWLCPDCQEDCRG